MHITESRLLLDWKIFSLRVHPCIFQPGNFTGWGSEGLIIVRINAATILLHTSKNGRKDCYRYTLMSWSINVTLSTGFFHYMINWS